MPEKSKEIEICPLCKGTGLDPNDPGNHDIPAKQWKKYTLCPKCKGEGK